MPCVCLVLACGRCRFLGSIITGDVANKRWIICLTLCPPSGVGEGVRLQLLGSIWFTHLIGIACLRKRRTPSPTPPSYAFSGAGYFMLRRCHIFFSFCRFPLFSALALQFFSVLGDFSVMFSESGNFAYASLQFRSARILQRAILRRKIA